MRIHPRHEVREEARRKLSKFIVEELMPLLSPTAFSYGNNPSPLRPGTELGAYR